MLRDYLALLTPAEQPLFSEFLQTIANANLFKDAFRADVSIANNAVFITNDRLAQAYYCKDTAKNKVTSLYLHMH